MKKQFYLQFALALTAVVLLASTVSAAGTLGFLFFDSTTGNSWTINDGESVGVTFDAESLLESSMTVNVALINSSTGVKVADLADVTTSSDSYSNHLTISKGVYLSSGNFLIKITVTGASGDVSTDELFLTVLAIPNPAVNRLPVITSTAITSVAENAAYNYQVTATDADGDSLTYTLVQNPSWLSISSDGLISGTSPNVALDTQYVVTVRVSDGQGSVTQTFTIDVDDSGTTPGPGGNHAPVITSSPGISVNENAAYSYQVVATDADNDSLIYSIIQSPSWIAISGNGLVSGTAPSVSSNTGFTILIEVADGNGGVTTQSYTLTVVNSGSGGGSGRGRASGGGSGTKFISDQSFEEGKYFDQFGPRSIVLEEPQKQALEGKSNLAKVLLIGLGLLVLALIVALLIFALRRL